MKLNVGEGPPSLGLMPASSLLCLVCSSLSPLSANIAVPLLCSHSCSLGYSLIYVCLTGCHLLYFTCLTVCFFCCMFLLLSLPFMRLPSISLLYCCCLDWHNGGLLCLPNETFLLRLPSIWCFILPLWDYSQHCVMF